MAAVRSDQFFQRGLGAFFWHAVFFLSRILPYPLFAAIGKGALDLYYSLAGRKLRRTSLDSLSVAFAERLTLPEKQRVARLSASNLMGGFAGIIYSATHPGFADNVFTLKGREELDRSLEKGKGALIAIAHFGPFAWMLFKFIDLGYRVNIVMRPPRNGYLYDKCKEGRKMCGLNPIYSVPVRNCVVECREALSRGELVFMPVDQNYGGPGRVFVDFFGRMAATAPGPVMFALKTGAPLFFAQALPEGKGRFQISLSRPIDLVSKETEKETMLANTALVTKMVENIARCHPEQWSWMHKRWKAVPREGEVQA